MEKIPRLDSVVMNLMIIQSVVIIYSVVYNVS